MSLITTPNLPAADDFYDALIRAHRHLEPEDSHSFNAKLILVLANHVGDLAVLEEALAVVARSTRRPPTADTPPSR